jgi:hypothetical protein
MSEACQVTHVVPVSTVTISLSRFESTATGNVDVSDISENLPWRDLAALKLSVRIPIDDLSVDMMVKRESVALSGVASSHGNK